MLKYPCLVLDHDDTVVQSERTVNYPCFLLALEKFRPGETMSYPEFVDWCFRYEFANFLRVRYGFTEEELREEYLMWLEYAKTHVPPACDGIGEVILEQKRRGGLVCVASLSGRANILRDYRTHFGIEPDLIFCSDDPREQRKPGTYPLERIMEMYGMKPEQLLMVDDLKTGYEMASAVGVPMAFAAWGRKDSPKILEKMGEISEYTFHSPEELGKFLFG